MKGLLSMPDATEKLIEAIRKCPNLYDHSRKEYRDTDIKDRVLQTVADSLNIPGLKGGDVWTRWRTLRDTYVKKKRDIVSSKKSGSETKTKKNWKYMKILQFLDPYVQEASTDSNFPESKSTFYEEQTFVDTESVVDSQRDTSDDEHNCETQVSQPPPASESPVGCDTPDLHSQCYSETIHQVGKRNTELSFNVKGIGRPPLKRQKMTEFEENFMQFARQQSSRLELATKAQSERHPMDAFFESCSLRAKQLSKETQGWLQMQFSTLLCSAECGEKQSVMQQNLTTAQSLDHSLGSTAPSSVSQDVTQHHLIAPLLRTPTATVPCISGQASQERLVCLTPGDSDLTDIPQSGLDILGNAMAALQE